MNMHIYKCAQNDETHTIAFGQIYYIQEVRYTLL